MKYWFKPARFWNWFAFYYPSSWQGWIIALVLAAAFIKLFILADVDSHSSIDTLINFTPWAVAILCIFDLCCFRFGEYPSWWRKNIKH